VIGILKLFGQRVPSWNAQFYRRRHGVEDHLILSFFDAFPQRCFAGKSVFQQAVPAGIFILIPYNR
jgi:hypothetical protein